MSHTVCISQIAQGVNFTVPFSIAVYMVRSFDPAAGEELIARRTGYLASSFMLATFLVSIPWGYVSDRMGRKPVVVIGQSAASISMVHCSAVQCSAVERILDFLFVIS